MTDDRPTANRTTCDTPVRVEGETTVTENDRYEANMSAYVQAATRRAEQAEQRLQAAQAEHEAMRALIVAYRAYDDHVAINRHECRFCGVGYERACDVAGALEADLEAKLAAYDALSAPAAEPEVQP